MYNLLISSDTEDFEGNVFKLARDRFLEHTDLRLQPRFEELDDKVVAELRRFPCIFAYETGRGKSPKFGRIKGVDKTGDTLEIHYEVIAVEPFLTEQGLLDLEKELGFHKLERYRTHWAVKDVALGVVLKEFPLPSWAAGTGRPVDIRTHTFDVAFSFAGENRDYVRETAREVTGLLGRDAVFFDETYEGQLARPGIDTLLQGIYRRAKIVVVVLSQHYAIKRWCTVEFRAIREIIQSRDHDHIMYVRVDSAPIDGVLSIDGYLDASRYAPDRLAIAIRDRFDLL